MEKKMEATIGLGGHEGSCGRKMGTSSEIVSK